MIEKRSLNRSYLIPWVFGSGMTIVGLAIGCFIARVATFTCHRDVLGKQQGYCQLKQSTLLMPWNETVSNIPLDRVKQAEVVKLGHENYTVVLKLENNQPDFLLYRSEYAENMERLSATIDSFLKNRQMKSFQLREGGGTQEAIAILGFCGFGVLFGWAGAKFSNKANAKVS